MPCPSNPKINGTLPDPDPSTALNDDIFYQLNGRQRRFIEAYIANGQNLYKAAISAGYSERTAPASGSRLLKNLKVRKALVMAREKTSSQAVLDAVWVLNRLRIISDRCMQVEAVFDKEGNKTGEYRFKPEPAIRATELIGRHIGMFADRLKIGPDVESYKELIGMLKEFARGSGKEIEAEYREVGKDQDRQIDLSQKPGGNATRGG